MSRAAFLLATLIPIYFAIPLSPTNSALGHVPKLAVTDLSLAAPKGDSFKSLAHNIYMSNTDTPSQVMDYISLPQGSDTLKSSASNSKVIGDKSLSLKTHHRTNAFDFSSFEGKWDLEEPMDHHYSVNLKQNTPVLSYDARLLELTIHTAPVGNSVARYNAWLDKVVKETKYRLSLYDLNLAVRNSNYYLAKYLIKKGIAPTKETFSLVSKDDWFVGKLLNDYVDEKSRNIDIKF